MSPVNYHIILKYRLMIPLFYIGEVCSVCCKTCLDAFEEHAIKRPELLW